MRICICGGGNLAHVIGGWLASRENCEACLLTRRPECWADDGIDVHTPDKKVLHGVFSVVSSDPEEVMRGVDMVLVCLPGFAIAPELEKIAPYVKPGMSVGSVVSSTGFFLMAKKILPQGTPLFGFQRVPFIARVGEYGKSAYLLGYKKNLPFATLNFSEPEFFGRVLESLFDIPAVLLDDWQKVTLTNSNPILHPSRLYTLFCNDSRRFEKPVLFYEDWDDMSSEVLVRCDQEYQTVLEKMGIDGPDMPTLLEYYESADASSLTRKIRSIDAFKGLLAPMKKISDSCFVPDYENRYFTEDFPFGLLLIKGYAMKYQVETPQIDAIIEWEQNAVNREYMKDGQLIGSDVKESIVPFIC